MEQICVGGYEKVDRIMANKEGNLISKDWEENKYVVRNWYVGRECDTENEQEILAVVENLARLHRVMHLPDAEEFEHSFTASYDAGTECRVEKGALFYKEEKYKGRI